MFNTWTAILIAGLVLFLEKYQEMKAKGFPYALSFQADRHIFRPLLAWFLSFLILVLVKQVMLIFSFEDQSLQGLLMILAAYGLARYQSQSYYAMIVLVLFSVLAVDFLNGVAFDGLIRAALCCSVGVVVYPLLMEGLLHRLAFSKITRIFSGLPILFFLSALIYLIFLPAAFLIHL